MTWITLLMTHTLIRGGLLAVTAFLTLLLGEAWGFELTHVTLLGLALGAIVAIVDEGSFVGRVAALLVGVAIAWAGYGLRAGFLPDSDLGRAVAVALVIAVATAVAVASFGRLPLWAVLAGMAALAGAYEAAFAANTPLFASESVTAVTSVVLTLVVGLVAASAVTPAQGASRHHARHELEDVR